MKQSLTYATFFLIIAIITIGGTYAFFTARTTSDKPLLTGTHQLEVIYTGDTEINGNLNLVKDKNDGHRRQVSIRLSENSVGASANIYINVDQITSSLATAALIWEIYKIENEQEIKVDDGTFLDCGQLDETKTKCTNGKRIYMINNLELTTTPQTFAIYIWLNGYKAGNEVLGSAFKGYIGAETENVTGTLQ